ncbi:valine--tRNA ligase, mitochondrial 1 isoform X2 [Selaginella moellendorffii]|uniref:valine--tRNA ligase, mitochondrial 1 isoform X2 n=1 Tax=Selaginella moellendorffii TaxID=88036 RepID=UPI000D1CB175|nr:valine--tRNA ligase, mitochondrial 1 isoform X2 [Selaginella moellendorffii]|eukprot:XP_024531973.1 valine--tRNA ligase, mitochondrial 1 isoform X2 [Selaginella moellendorffii]
MLLGGGPSSMFLVKRNFCKVVPGFRVLSSGRVRLGMEDGAPEDLERKKKKEEKAREKELKKLKAAQKAEAKKLEANAAKVESKKEKKGKESNDDLPDSKNPYTPSGEKKRLAPVMAQGYNPALVEASWYEYWEKQGFFVADASSQKPKFVMVIPPPNVTGVLHIGHALMCAVEDTLTRWRRMKGYETLWVPGVDHAGISTQVVVEKKIMREKGLTRHDVGREDFVKEVWSWKEQHGTSIFSQLRKMGASVDWSRECFTMDEPRCKAVVEAFVRFHKDGLLYRDNRLVNWDCVLRTAISDIEVDYIDVEKRTLRKVPGYKSTVEFGALTSFAYPLEDGKGEIVVATTRPETMLGDSAVAVHPEDPRYSHLHGKFVVHPFNGRKLPIICDAVLVDMNFGTGAVKITPAHDPNDFLVGKRHNLQFINILTDDGKINGNGGPDFQGMMRFDARAAVLKALEDKGLYRGVADNSMRLGICSRTGDVVEPMIKPQWYVSCKDIAAKACNAVRTKELEIIPSQFEDTWFRWLENIRDWCVSRQLWWGHQIPAWYCTFEGDELKEMGAYNDHWIVARSETEARVAAEEKFSGKKIISFEQDPDVLDTWFSSGLFPFSVLGWPEATKDLQAFYPTTLLETGHDILFFWVARMVMMGIQLTGEVPFKQIFLHAMVRDAHGRKMSKSLGNVIDPLDVIHGITLDGLKAKLSQGNLDPAEYKTALAGLQSDFPEGIPVCGADALRFALVNYTAQSENINLDVQRVAGYRYWCNKLWNAIRFAMLNLGDNFIPSEELNISELPWSCKWILSALNGTVAAVDGHMEKYDLSAASSAIYSWWQYDLCDVFIELTKPTLSKGDSEDAKKLTRDTLWVCLENGLRLLHPFMPFVTEELWQRLPRAQEENSSIMLASYPTRRKDLDNEAVDAEMTLILSTVKAVRALCAACRVQPKQKPGGFIVTGDAELFTMFTDHSSELATLANLSSMNICNDVAELPAGCAVTIVNDKVSAYVMLQGIVDLSSELSKLLKQKDEESKKIEVFQKKISSQVYKDKASEEVQEADRARLAKMVGELELRVESIQLLQKLV